MPNGTIAIDEEMRAFELAQARQAKLANEEEAEEGPEDAGDETAPARQVSMNMFIANLVLAVAMINDTLDYFIIGSIPVVGDILDGATWGIILLWVYSQGLRRPPFWGLTGAIEIIPFGDLIPTYTLMVLWIIHDNRKS
ncbi:MAG: hypothetical protein HYT22_00805 [Candidatus Niyogibacteria bacterium]|nr:hypothetical protein [Candidatus Niyogibacteria bacterium]